MSKKMLKRSLVLGALMAFVITGSAWAADENSIVLSQNTGAGYVFNDVNKALEVNGIVGNTSNDIVAKSLTVNSATNNGINGYGRINIDVIDDVVISAKSNAVFVAPDKGSGPLSIKANSLIINSGTWGIHIEGTDSSNLNGEKRFNLEVDNLTINASNGITNNSIDNILVSAKDIEINASETYGVAANGVGNGGLKISATNNLVIKYTGNTYGALSCIYSELVVGADGTTIIEGDILQGSRSKKIGDGNIYVTLNGEDSYFTGATEINGTGSIGLTFNDATWNLKGASTLTNATFNAGSTLVIDGVSFEKNTGVYALNGVGDKATLTVEEGAKLKINNIKETTYNIANGFTNLDNAVDKWDVSDINTLMQGVAWTSEEGLQVKVFAKDGEDIAEDLGVSETTGDFLSNLAKDAGNAGEVEKGSAKEKLVGLANAAAKSNNDVVKAKAAAQAAEAVQKMAEAGGNSATAANVVNNVANVTGQRLSFGSGNHGGNKGGHGVGLIEEGSGAAIWAQYVHGKDSVEDMPSDAGASSYEGQYNGIVMGVDFKKVGKFQSGIAFNYGEGDTNSVNTTSPTCSEYDFWGIGYYGNIRNADSNVIFDIGYSKTDSDVTNNVIAEGYAETFEASPETTTWTAGVKVEKLYQNNNVQVVPYTGLRYMSIDPEDYSTKCGAMGYKMERQDIWLLPLGVSIRQEVVNNNGWVVTPKVDLSYIWAFGDTDSTIETNTVFGTDNRPVGYDVMDEGSWMGLVGVEAAMDDWTFGVSYSYQKGDHSESKKWYVDAKYSF